MKKAQRKLIPAFAMLLVSTIMLSTASYAWFTMNATVSAKGMQVKAVSPSSLLISAVKETHSDAAAGVPSALTNVVNLAPASTTDEATGLKAVSPKFYKVTDSKGITYNSAAAGIGTKFEALADEDVVSTNEGAASTGNVAKHSFWISNTAVNPNASGDNTQSNKKDLYISNITVSGQGSGQDLTKALRVGVVCGSNAFIYAPGYAIAPSNHAIIKAGTVETNSGELADSSGNISKTFKPQPNTYSSLSTNVLCNKIPTNNGTWQQVDIYIWYEGSDDNCSTDKSVGVKGLNVEVEFSAQENK